jgi:SAM-dependent methyltransferase
MNSDETAQQRRFFNIGKHQYAQASILAPPLHTRLEIQAILTRLNVSDPEATILDFGAGTGRLTIPLLQRGFSVLSVDISDQSLKKLTTLAHSNGFTRLETTDALPTDRRFKTIVGADILHHVDLDEQLPKIHQALEPGGKAIFTEPGGLHPFWYVFITVISDWRIEKNIPRCNFFNLRAKFRKYGFRDIRITGLGILPRPLANWSLKACSTNDLWGNIPLIRPFAYRYIVEATV